MATTFTWKIVSMVSYPQYQGQTDVVCIIYWTVVGTQDTTFASFSGSTDLTFNPNSPFTPYSQLSETQVVGWVQASLGAPQIATIEANIQQQIDSQLNPPVALLPLPWSQS